MVLAAAMGAMTFFQSMMAGEQQKSQNALQRAQFEEQEFNRKMQNQQKNRQIAKANAAKWMQNRNIAKAANKSRAEQEFWIQYNHENASGQFSRGFNKVNSQLQSNILQRGIKPSSQTAQALLRQSIETARKGMTSMSMNKENALVSAERKQRQALARRDFGYSNQEAFIKGEIFQQSDSSIMQGALMSGIMGGTMAGLSTAASMSASEATTDTLKKAAGPSVPDWGGITSENFMDGIVDPYSQGLFF